MDHKSLRARVFDGRGWNKAYVEGALIHDLWAEIERLSMRVETAEPLIRQATPSRAILTDEGAMDWQARRFEWLSSSASGEQK